MLFFTPLLILMLAINCFASTVAALSQYTIKPGDTLYSLLKQQNFSDDQLRTALKNNPLPKSHTLKLGDRYFVIRDPAQKKLEIRFLDKHKDLSYVFWRKANKSGAKREKEHFRKTIHTVEGHVEGSILASILEKVNSNEIAYRFMDAYIYEYNIKRELKRGAKFVLVFEKVYKGDTFLRYGEILKTSLEINDQNVTRFFVKTKNGGFFYSPDMKLKKRPLYSPVSYQRITSLYQPRRLHPIKKRRQPHLGVDFELPEGEKIFSVSSGKIVKKGRRRGTGKYIVIKHNNGYTSYYNHLLKHVESLKVGDNVKHGQLIGYIGCSGYCTKPHLHFAVKKKGHYINPLPLLKNYTYSQNLNYLNKTKKLLSKTNDNKTNFIK